ncbi:hypothetical protein HDU85_006401 [Gaertneriomyces sp. JEL0708]|nr:hypothetical protein HDU85_006401 [Gaertneriomyces sp. JEL0708]
MLQVQPMTRITHTRAPRNEQDANTELELAPCAASPSLKSIADDGKLVANDEKDVKHRGSVLFIDMQSAEEQAENIIKHLRS